MLKFQFCSDLHLEFSANKKWLTAHPLVPNATHLILAGDIMPFREIDLHRDFIDYLSDHFEFTYWLPGNHEFYHSDLARWESTIHEFIRPNVLLLNNRAVYVGGTKLIFSTLWSKISAAAARVIEFGLNDFHHIRSNGLFFSVHEFNKLHITSLQYIEDELNHEDLCKRIVITHHVPTFQHYPRAFEGDVLSQAFASELSPKIEQSNISAWIYGHHHHNHADFCIGQTRMMTNQLGYVHRNEHHEFDCGRLLEW